MSASPLPVTSPAAARDPLAPMRRLLLGIFGGGAVGVAAELVLLEHYEDAWQYAPLLLLVAGAVLTAMVAWRATRGRVRLFRALLALYLVAGAVGTGLHFKGNVEFELERRPDAPATVLAWESLRGATPALAPGTMVLLALVGLVATMRHPALAVPAPAERPSARPR